jgi:hypothetical protein
VLDRSSFFGADTELLGNGKKRKKGKKKEKRSSKKCEYLAIWTLFLKFSLAVNDVFFDETFKSTSKKIVNRRKKNSRDLDILGRKNVGKLAFFFGVLRPKVRPEAERRDVV